MEPGQAVEAEQTNVARLGRPPGVDGADRQQRILLVAERLFAQVGYAAATTHAIAGDCGITAAGLYRYFGNKAALYDAVSASIYSRLIETFTVTVPEDGGFATWLDRYMDGLVQLREERPHMAGFILLGYVEAQRHPELEPIVHRDFGLLTEALEVIVATGQRTGEIDRDAQTHDVVELLLSLLAGLAHHAARGSSMEEHRRVVRLFERTIEGRLFLGVNDA